MKFTDDKLRIFKNVMLAQTAPIYVVHSELEALLHRLECAEKVVEAVNLVHDKKTYTCGCSVCDDLDAWRKSKGE